VTVAASIVPALRRLTWDAGALDALASIRHIEASVFEINTDPGPAIERMIEQGRAAVESDGADTLILGCMSMGFLDVAEQMSDELGVPVLNPSRTALKMAEATVAIGVTHSRRDYHKPPKLSGGASLDSLTVGQR
jgi:allantoin racemase